MSGWRSAESVEVRRIRSEQAAGDSSLGQGEKTQVPELRIGTMIVDQSYMTVKLVLRQWV